MLRQKRWGKSGEKKSKSGKQCTEYLCKNCCVLPWCLHKYILKHPAKPYKNFY